MRINEKYPTPDTFRKNELETLRFIKDNGIFSNHYSRLATDANTSYYKFNNKHLLSFSFESDINIFLDRKARRNGKAYIGTMIKFVNAQQYEQVSYSLSICENSGQKERIVRKYHFDYALPDPNSRQPHPIFHMQYGGELYRHLKTSNMQHDHLDLWLSEPRLIYLPMSLALIINLIFKEFPDENSLKIIELSTWRDLVRKNEKLLLQPYFRSCHSFLNSNTNLNRLFINDFCYGN